VAGGLRTTARCEDPDVQAIIEVGTESVETQEFARTDLCDKRLDRRLLKTAEHLAKSPASPINEACGDWASTQADSERWSWIYPLVRNFDQRLRNG